MGKEIGIILVARRLGEIRQAGDVFTFIDKLSSSYQYTSTTGKWLDAQPV